MERDRVQATLRAVLAGLVALGTLAGICAGWKRHQVEMANRRVELAVDYVELKSLCELTARPFPRALERLKAAGVTSVAVPEDTFGSLETRGELRIVPGSAGRRVEVDVLFVYDRILRVLQKRGIVDVLDADRPGLPATTLVLSPTSPVRPSRVNAPARYTVPISFSSLRSYGLGIDPMVAGVIGRAGLQPVARLASFPGASPPVLRAVMDDARAAGARTVIFLGTEVMGFRGQETETAAALEEAGLQYGQVEFGKQAGDAKLSRILDGRCVRVHSIPESELAGLDETEIVDRFVRAAAERNIRLCYVRLPYTAGLDPLEQNARLVERIARGLAQGEGMVLGPAHIFKDPAVPGWVLLVAGLGIAAGAVLLVLRLAALPAGAAVGLFAVLAALCVVLAMGLGETGRKLAALGAALVFPTLACLRRDLLSVSPEPPVRSSSRAAAGRGVVVLLTASAVTLAGAAHVVALLSTRPFMLKASQFAGIKAAHALPLLVVAAVAAVGMPAAGRPLREQWDGVRTRAASLMAEPARVGLILLALAGLVALALLVARTGNEPGVGISGLELKLRSVLDRVLPVRPRTKEFLIGHPAFVLAVAFWLRGRRRWVLPLFVVGAIGQVSVLNTFCHIHTPVALSLVRAATGLACGAALGALLFWLVDGVLPGARSAREPDGRRPLAAAARVRKRR